MTTAHNIGLSGFAVDTLRDSFSSTSGAAVDMLEAYAKKLSALEVDSTYYRAVSERSAQRWAEVTPEDFCITMRVFREVETPEHLAEFVEDLAPLGRRLRCLVFSPGSKFEFDLSFVESMTGAVAPEIRTAWELSHPSWLSKEAIYQLSQLKTTIVVRDVEASTVNSELLEGTNFDFVYIRLRRSTYTAADVIAWGELLGQTVGQRELFAFFKASPEASAYVAALREVLVEG